MNTSKSGYMTFHINDLGLWLGNMRTRLEHTKSFQALSLPEDMEPYLAALRKHLIHVDEAVRALELEDPNILKRLEEG